jgi:hypothetical protein
MSTGNSDEIGYCKPPQHGRFKKGKSGNPLGRPRGRPNLATVLERALREKVVINENGKRETITKLEAAIKQLVNKAANGDLQALRQLAALKRSGDERSGDVTAPNAAMTEVDQKVFERILRRYGAKVQGDEDAE